MKQALNSILFTNKVLRQLDSTKIIFASFPFSIWLSNLHV